MTKRGKRIWKQSFSGLLSLSVLAGQSASVFALENPEAEHEHSHEEHVHESQSEAVVLTLQNQVFNPLYYPDAANVSTESYTSNIVLADEENSIEVTNDTFETDMDKVADTIRSYMKAREPHFELRVYFDAGDTDLQDYIINSFKEVVDQALEHTGVSNEGDYLLYQFDNYSVTTNAVVMGNTAYADISVDFVYYTDAAMEAEVDAALEEIYAGFTENADTLTTTEEIYTWITEHVTYDDAAVQNPYPEAFTAYGALINGTSVCQGYSVLMYRMLLDHDIDARIIAGRGDGQSHAWNIALADDGYYYNYDATWDAGYSKEAWQWFMQPSETFTRHTPDEKFTTHAFQAVYPISSVAPEDVTYNDVVFRWDENQEEIYAYLSNTSTGRKTVVLADVEAVTAKFREPTCKEDGVEVFKASVAYKDFKASQELSRAVPALGHDYKQNMIWDYDNLTVTAALNCSRCDFNAAGTAKAEVDENSRNEADCTHAGNAHLIAKVSVINDEGQEVLIEEEKDVTLPALGHDYSDGVVVSWNEDFSKADITKTCARCNETVKFEALVEDRGVVKEANCGEDGYFEVAALDPETKEVLAISHDKLIKATGTHTYEYAKAVFVWNEDGSADASYKCSTCGHEASEAAKVNDRVKEATCLEDGQKTSTATFYKIDETGKVLADLSDEKVTVLPATGHALPEETSMEWTEDLSSAVASVECEKCHISFETRAVVVKEETIPASCTKDGEITYTATAEVANRQVKDVKTEVIPAFGHDYKGEITFSPQESTATAAYTCDNCGSRHMESIPVEKTVVKEVTCEEDGEVIFKASHEWEGVSAEKEETLVVEALGHDIEGEIIWDDKTREAQGHFFCNNCDVDVTDQAGVIYLSDQHVDATCSKEGQDVYEAEAILVKGEEEFATVKDTKVYTIRKLRHTLNNGICAVCEDDFNDFVDMKPTDWYYDHAIEAHSRGLMSGTDLEKGLFAPLNTLTRGQVITILYRMAGSPEVEFEPVFQDVKDGMFFSAPIVWAANTGITTGYEPDEDGNRSFGPSDPVTRQQLAVFLYNFAKDNGKDVSARVNLEEQFPDGRYVADWGKDAMSWMVAEGMISGLNQNGTLMAAPSASANRGMMAKLAVMIDDYILDGKAAQ